MSDDDVVRQILSQVEEDPGVSQKKLSASIGVSVGMVNLHMKRCVAKGFIKLQQAPVRRYLYYLTPEGFAEKTRLTSRYVKASFSVFLQGKEQYGAILNLCAVNGWRQILLLGNTDLADLVELVSMAHQEIEIRGILDVDGTGRKRSSIPVFNSPEEVLKDVPRGRIDAGIGCHLIGPEIEVPDWDAIGRQLGLAGNRVLVPAFLS